MFMMFHADPRHRPWLIAAFLLLLVAGLAMLIALS
jgi:hypothetical protein